MKSLINRYVLGVLVAVTTAIAAFSTDAFSDILGTLALTDVVMVLILFGLFVLSQMGGKPVMDKLIMRRMRSERRFVQLSQTYFAAALAYALLVYLVNGADEFLIAMSVAAFLGVAMNTILAIMPGCMGLSKCSKPSEMEDMDESSEKTSSAKEGTMTAKKKKPSRKKKRTKKKTGKPKEEPENNEE